MSNTVIQIKRSTETAAPSLLQPGELAFTSNGDSLWIGSPSGSNTANVVHIGSVISYTGNSTQIGETSAGSNTELASTYAIKQFVDGKLNSFSTTLSGLDDVDVSSAGNNSLLIYNESTNTWGDHTVSGTANEVDITFSNQDLTIGLPDNVTISSNLTISGELANVVGNAMFRQVVTIQQGGTPHLLTYPTLQATMNVDSYVQMSIQNDNSGPNTSADFVAYMNNADNYGVSGFVDIGATSNGFSEPSYSVTAPNEAYLFGSAPAGANTSGSLVIATDSTGTNNDIKFFVGGFTYNSYEPHMVLTGTGRNLGINNASPTDKLSVGGSAFIGGKATVQDVIPVANVTYSLGNTTNQFLNLYANTVTGANANFTTIAGTLSTANQPNITNVGTLAALTVTGVTTLNGNVLLGDTSGDTVAINGVVNTSIIPSANVTYDLGSATSSWANVYAAQGTFGNVSVSGDLTVLGTLTTIDTENIVIEDPMIRLAKNQANTGSFTDVVDIGFYGVYGNTSQVVYTGFARDASANVFILFDGLDQAPDNVVNTSAISIATLNAYLTSGAFISNSSAVSITANSSVAVSITANTLSLTTALGVASGGTGRNTLTDNYVLVGDGTNQVDLVGSSTQGHVLQINGSGAPVFGHLDGGTF